jgi:hypothetical protein
MWPEVLTLARSKIALRVAFAPERRRSRRRFQLKCSLHVYGERVRRDLDLGWHGGEERALGLLLRFLVDGISNPFC